MLLPINAKIVPNLTIKKICRDSPNHHLTWDDMDHLLFEK